jgi:hypothetical protein
MLQSWTRYNGRALIAIVGKGRPNEGARLHVDLVEGPALIDLVTVTARTEPVPQFAPGPASVPWIVVSVRADRVAGATECVLRLDGEDISSPCRPTGP